MSHRHRRRRTRPPEEGTGDGGGGQGELLGGGEPDAGHEEDEERNGPVEFEMVVDESSGYRPDGPGAGDPGASHGSGGQHVPDGERGPGEGAEAEAGHGSALEDAPAGEQKAAGESEPAPRAVGPVVQKLGRARDLVKARRVEEAIALYREVIYEDAQNVKARNNLGVLLDEAGSPELALEQFEAARDLEPESVEVLTNLGSVLSSLGRYEEAERELRRAQRIEPESVAVRASLGVLQFRRGLYTQAEAELRWVCERDADHGPAHFYRGEALNRLGKVDPALEALERAVHLQPYNARAYYTMGILYDRKNLPVEAQAMYRRARELSRPESR